AAIWIGSPQRFLRAKIDEQFPDLLQTTAHDLDLWYAQRELDIATFAASDTLATGLRSDAPDRAASEAQRYLAYVQHGFPQYPRLFVLDSRAQIRFSVGTDFGLPAPLLQDLANAETTRVSAVVGTRDRRLQLVSAPISSGGRRVGTLHAVLDVASLETQLGARDLDKGTGLYVIGPGSTVLAHSPGAAGRLTFERA